jgi:preprotein translocase subunit SecF
MSPASDKPSTGTGKSGTGKSGKAGDEPVRSETTGRIVKPVEKSLAKTSLWSRLYHGETNFNIVGRRRLWFVISGVVLLIGLVSLFTRDLHLGIDFEGGVVWEVPAGDASVADARDAVAEAGVDDATVTTLESDEGVELRIAAEPLSAEEGDQVTAALAELTGSSTDEVSFTSVGPSWGNEISQKAVRALVVFLVLVTIYIALRFETKMAIPTLVALLHDVLFTVGVYSVTQFEVTPATVIAILTILGFSIYDGIVVFDKVDENTRLVSSTGGLSYGGMVNLSLNQALMRSLNTSITALLPVGSLLVVGSWIMGASTLEEFALALLIGLFSGAYSSIFIASPLLAVLKEREPRYRDIKRRIEARGGDQLPVAAGGGAGSVGGGSGSTAGGRDKTPAKVGGDGSGASPGPAANGGAGPARPGSTRVIPPRPRKKDRRGR